MTNLIKKIEWTTKAGKSVAVTMTLQLTREIDADGYKTLVPCCEMHTRVTVGGQTVGYSINTIDTTHPAYKLGAVAMCGNLGITQVNYDKILAARAEIESTPEWQAEIARQAAADAAERDYDAHRATMQKVMGY